MDKAKISENLRRLRGTKSLASVAGEVGVTPSALSNYEAGIRVPRDEVKKALADYYGETVDAIFFS